MARDLNKVMLTGRLGADPEMRFTPQGSAVTTFRVASNRAWKTTGGEQKEDTEWFSIVAWNKLGEICNQYLTKGSRVYIEGRSQTRSWVDDATGQTRYKTEVIASEMIILDNNSAGAGGGYSAAENGDYESDLEPPPAAPAVPARRPAPAAPVAGAGRNAVNRPAPQANAQPPRSARRPFVQPTGPAPDGDDLPF